MTSPRILADVVRDSRALEEHGESLVQEVVAREGAAAVVATVVRLVEERADRFTDALRFLTFARDVPALAEAVDASAELASELESMLRGPDVRERGTAIWALGDIQVRDRDALLGAAADWLLSENEIVSLGSLLTVVELPDAVDRLVASDDWLVRWSLLPWTNQAVDSPIADDVRRRLAFDDHPLVSAEAHQHLMMLDEFQAANAGAQGVVFAVLSNHGPALAFRSVASAFVASWPADKTTYDLEELRAFALRLSTDDPG